ncbi:NAD(P)H-dependent oxidoreductase [Gammaproteobacteria bacterium AS21]
MIKILAFSGSNRKDSANKKMLEIAAIGARAQGAEVSVVHLEDLNLPMFSEDLEAQGLPEGVLAFKKLMLEHDGLMIASPEYNSSYSPLLKNAIDWASRQSIENEKPLSAYDGKFAVIMAASPGALGGMRGLAALRMLLSNIKVNVLANQVTLGGSFQAFNEDLLSLVNPKKQQSIVALGAQLAQMLQSQR